MSAKSDRTAAIRRHNFTEANDLLAMLGERFDGSTGLAPIEHGDHADPAIKGAQHFKFGDLSGGSEPFEHRQNRDMLKRHANAKPGR